MIIKACLRHPWRTVIALLSALLFPFLIILLLFFTVIGISESQVPNLCSTQSNSSSSVGDISGTTSGSWTQKGTSAYKEAKETYTELRGYGMDAVHAAAATGNAGHESAGFTGGLKRNQFGCPVKPEINGKCGYGMFQFTGQFPKYGWSPLGQVKSIMANGLTVSGKQWMHQSGSLDELTYDFEKDFERGDPEEQSRDKFAHTAYKLFNGLGGASDIADTANTPSGNNSCSSSTDSGSDSSILVYAKKWLNKIHYDMGGHASGATDLKNGKQPQSTDCSGFVEGVLAHCGYKVPSTYPSTPTEGKMPCLKHISPSQAKAGDVVIVNKGGGSGSNGHTAFLYQDWHGDNTKVIQESHYASEANVNIHPYGLSFSSLAGGDREFYHPVK